MAYRRGSLWLALTGIGLLLYVAAEVSALIWVAGEIGWWTLLILVLSSVVGVVLLQREWRRTWARLSDSLRTGQLPSGQLADASLVLGGGILLILPGLLSDIAGVLLLLPFTRPFVRSALSWWAGRSLQQPGGPVIIKGETVEVTQTLPPPLSEPEAGVPDSTGQGIIIEGTIIDPHDESGR